jgi:hypothetical protein
MGFELNRIMKQYGVNTPGMANYTGSEVPSAPKEPVAPAVGSEEAEGGLYPAAQTKYKADLAAYQTSLPELTRKYDADQAIYNTYKTAYQNRLQNTPMYSQGQFQTTAQPVAKTVADLYKMYLGRDPEAGIAGSAAASTRPNFIQEAQNELNTKPNFGNQNLMNITGSYYGNQLKNPVYATQVAPVATPVTNTNNALLNASNFDSKAYLAANPDVADEINRGVQNFGDAYGHYTRYGKNEGRAAPMIVAAHGGSVHDLVDKYADGGQVKTHYQTAGAVKLPSGYGSVEEEQDFANRFYTPSPVEINRVDMREPPPPVTVDLMPAPVAAAPRSVLTEVAANNLKADPMPAAPVAEVVPVAVAPVAPKAAVPFGNERLGNIQALLATYGPKDSAYAEDLKTARAAAKAESDAFANMLKTAMSSPEDAQSSKAEMYFRLAAAFGAPTKTGQFSENLGMVGKELGEYAKGKRATTQQKLALALEAQKMKMTSSKEDLNTLRTLAGKEMDDKRAIATELIKDYIKSGEPQSAAGKQALDEGLKPGTEAYQKRVGEIGNMKVEAQMAQITSTLANMGTAQANLALNQEKFKNQQSQQAKLTGPELKLKVDAEDTLAQTDSALGILKQAFALNPNTFDTSVSDMAQRKALEVTNSKHPKVVATREQENLLEKAALAQLKSTFPGAISNDERKALQDVQGLGAKSIEERGKIMKNAYKALQSVRARHAKRLVDINQGVYRDTTSSIDGGTD